MVVSENEIGLREARAQLGELVSQAQYSGVTTYITRHGRRVAAIVPVALIPQEKTMTAKTATDIRPALDRSGEDDGWNWAEEATAQWIEAAEKAGLEVEVVSIEVPDVNCDAAIVEVGGEQYVLTVRGDDEIRPVSHGGTVTLISATSGDQMPEGAKELAESDIDWDDLPENAQAWANDQGYGNDDELLYVLPGKVSVEGWPTLTARVDR